jgi:iron complex transport system substrate-binding protein
LRIISLIASATEIVHSLGLTRFQVGRSHECDYPEEVLALPVCTRPAISTDGSSAEIDALVRQKIVSAISVYEVYSDVLERLRPTHIITQTHCRVCAVSLDDVERALRDAISTRPTLVSLEPNSLADIWSDIRRVAEACGVTERGEQLVGNLQARMRKIAKLCRREGRPKVACIEWLEPLMAAGNWVPELIEAANAENSTFANWEQLCTADPDVILVSPCGFDLDRTSREMYWLTGRSGWPDLRAVRNGQVYLIDGNRYMNRPGPSVADSLQSIAEIVHPTAVPPTLEGVAWLGITC